MPTSLGSDFSIAGTRHFHYVICHNLIGRSGILQTIRVHTEVRHLLKFDRSRSYAHSTNFDCNYERVSEGRFLVIFFSPLWGNIDSVRKKTIQVASSGIWHQKFEFLQLIENDEAFFLKFLNFKKVLVFLIYIPDKDSSPIYSVNCQRHFTMDGVRSAKPRFRWLPTGTSLLPPSQH